MNDESQPVGIKRERQDITLVPDPSPDGFWAATMLHNQMHRYGTALRKRWWLFLVCFLLIGGATLLYAIKKPPTFRSQAMMWLSGRLSIPGSGGPFPEELSSYLGTQAELMKSRDIQMRAFQKVRSIFPEIAATVTNAQPDRIPFELTVNVSPKSSVVELEAKGRYAEGTRAFLDAVMDEYLTLRKNSWQQTSVDALAGITDQIKVVEQQIQNQQQALTDFGTSNNISYLTEQGQSAGSHLSKLVGVLSDLRTEYHLLESLSPEQFKNLSKRPQNSFSETSLPGENAASALALAGGASDAAYYQALQQIEVLKAKRDEFSQVLRPTHSKMLRLNQEITGLEQFLKVLKEEGEQQAAVELANREKSLELQIQNLETQYHDWESNASEANRKLAEHDRMKQDLQRSQALYDRLLEVLQTVDITKNVDLDPLIPLAAASPARPISTRLMIAFGGIFLAFMVSIGILFLLEAFDDRFTSVTEISCHLPEPVIGQIPETAKRGSNGAFRFLRHPDEKHGFSESFRHLRSSLFFMFEEGARPRIILVTSSIPKEGKSTVAAHLASTLAASGSRVLLIDADLRRSTLHEIFGVNLKPGLHEVLEHGVPSATAIVEVSAQPRGSRQQDHGPQPTVDAASFSSFFFLPAGTSCHDNSSLFQRSQMNRLFHDLATQYDHVIIDSPPVLATDDVISLASVSDGVLMVVRASYTSSRMVRDALDRMHRCKIKVIGIVYNRAAPSSNYYYRYGRDYHRAETKTIVSASSRVVAREDARPSSEKC